MDKSTHDALEKERLDRAMHDAMQTFKEILPGDRAAFADWWIYHFETAGLSLPIYEQEPLHINDVYRFSRKSFYSGFDQWRKGRVDQNDLLGIK